MNTEMKDRIKEAISAGGGPTRVSEKAGIVLRTLNNWSAGVSEPKITAAAQLAAACAVSLDWLATGVGNAQTGSQADQVSDFPLVPLYEAQASAGGGSFVEQAPLKDHIPFTPDFLRKRLGRSNTNGLVCVYARGDSMEPTIGNGDLIMIDTKQHDLSSDIFAFTFEDAFYIKRLQQQPGRLTVSSDNPAYEPFSLEREHMNELRVVGRIVHIGRVL